MNEHFQGAGIFVEDAGPKELKAIEEWISRWRPSLPLCKEKQFLGRNKIYEVLAPKEALDELPSCLVLRYDDRLGK